jgi:phosphoribosyl 1,2-cyclic phosphodiesterase
MLGSGSRGNGLLVRAGGTTILVDCGFTLRESERRLMRLAIRLEDLSAIVLTHEHGDHASGAMPLARRCGIPLWLTHGTARALAGDAHAGTTWRHFSGEQRFAVGDLELHPFTVPHDANEPCQFVFSDGRHRLGLLTDAGHVTPHMTDCLRGCDALVLECNHDREMLATGDYPPSLKARVGGPQGHLDNDAAADLLARLGPGRLQHVVAAHLSEKNNTPWLARGALGAALGGASERVTVASQEGGLPWRELV